eukprot:101274_1
MQIKIQKISKQQALTNCVYLHSATLKQLGLKEDDLIIIDEQVVHMVKTDNNLQEHELGSSKLLWQSLHLNTKKNCVGSMVTISPWETSKLNTNTTANTISIIIDTFGNVRASLKASELQIYVQKYFHGQVFCKDQRFVTKWQQSNGKIVWLCLRIAEIFSKKIIIDENVDEKKLSDVSDNQMIGTYKNKLKKIRFGRIDPTITKCLFMPVTS